MVEIGPWPAHTMSMVTGSGPRSLFGLHVGVPAVSVVCTMADVRSLLVVKSPELITKHPEPLTPPPWTDSDRSVSLEDVVAPPSGLEVLAIRFAVAKICGCV